MACVFDANNTFVNKTTLENILKNNYTLLSSHYNNSTQSYLYGIHQKTKSMIELTDSQNVPTIQIYIPIYDDFDNVTEDILSFIENINAIWVDKELTLLFKDGVLYVVTTFLYAVDSIIISLPDILSSILHDILNYIPAIGDYLRKDNYYLNFLLEDFYKDYFPLLNE